MAASTFDINSREFQLFPDLPTEIRLQIWREAIEPHIIRWVRTDDTAILSNVFSSSRKSFSLQDVCHEAREATHHSGITIPSVSSKGKKGVWLDFEIDHFHLDPAWTGLNDPPLAEDPLESLLFDYELVKKIMIHPNYSDGRMRPGVMLEKMTGLERILVVADEKSIGTQSKWLQACVYDLQKYYEQIKRRLPTTKIPYIAVGCLGWVGEEKGKLHHADEDGRQLVAVFDGHAQMKEHLSVMREEEMKFLKERFNHRKPGLTLHFRPGMSMDQVPPSTGQQIRAVDDGSAANDEQAEMGDLLPSYSQSNLEAAPPSEV